MKSLYLAPETKDLVFDENLDLIMVEGIDEAAQHLRLLLSTRLGEWFLNIKYGLDHGEILGQKIPTYESRIRSAIYDAISRDNRNIRITSLNLDYNIKTRILIINIIAIIDNNEVTVEVSI